MTFRNAKKLHNEDEVVSKKTGEVLTVLSAYVENKNVILECVGYKGQCYQTLTHKQIM